MIPTKNPVSAQVFCIHDNVCVIKIKYIMHIVHDNRVLYNNKNVNIKFSSHDAFLE
jgi:hypothetical protein